MPTLDRRPTTQRKQAWYNLGATVPMPWIRRSSPRPKRSTEVFFKACAAQLQQVLCNYDTHRDGRGRTRQRPWARERQRESERERETEPQRKPHGGQRRGYVSSKFTSTWTIKIKLLLRILPLFNYYDDSYTTGTILILLRGWYTATMLLPLLLLLLYNIYICIYI